MCFWKHLVYTRSLTHQQYSSSIFIFIFNLLHTIHISQNRSQFKSNQTRCQNQTKIDLKSNQNQLEISSNQTEIKNWVCLRNLSPRNQELGSSFVFEESVKCVQIWRHSCWTPKKKSNLVKAPNITQTSVKGNQMEKRRKKK